MYLGYVRELQQDRWRDMGPDRVVLVLFLALLCLFALLNAHLVRATDEPSRPNPLSAYGAASADRNGAVATGAWFEAGGARLSSEGMRRVHETRDAISLLAAGERLIIRLPTADRADATRLHAALLAAQLLRAGVPMDSVVLGFGGVESPTILLSGVDA